ncbi:MAG: isochorismatase family protein [Bacteroidales bacterium]
MRLRTSMKSEKSIPVIVIVDMLYDFIDGTLACQNSERAVREAVKFINNHDTMAVAYICDHHPANHSSFTEFGGVWPPHCVQGTRGGSIHDSFYSEISNKSSRPDKGNLFHKGEEATKEQYSGYEAVSSVNGTLDNYIKLHSSDKENSNVYVCGIATEFCINATVRDLADSGRMVYIISDALGYVEREGHEKSLKELSHYKNVTII